MLAAEHNQALWEEFQELVKFYYRRFYSSNESEYTKMIIAPLGKHILINGISLISEPSS